MKTLKSAWIAGGMVGLLAMGMSSIASASLIVDRGLPNSNLNSAAGPDRSNVAWDFGSEADGTGDAWIAGDDFTLPCLSCQPKHTDYWNIYRITVWAIAGGYVSDFQLGDRYQTISLFLGQDQGEDTVVPRVATANVTGNETDNANVTITPVDYPDNPGVAYQGSGGSFIQIWQIDFFDLGIFSEGQYLFAADGISTTGDPQPLWFNHASNAALSGTPQDQSDDLYRWFFGNAGLDEIVFGGMVDSDGFGWDKSSDINIRVYAEHVRTDIPEPGSLLLMGMGILGLLSAMRRRRMFS
ncbi:PEP-CTERM sorting domain-containing protein [Ectothiorhodospira sp. B14B]|nr:PEP-CTERM sorting domain-containing protein [Ectothiorhodospira lacustris]